MRIHPELISAARRINEGMSAHVTAQVLRLMALKQVSVVGSRILVLGATFKENCPDLRNTRVREIVDELRACHAQVDVHDPHADPDECERECGFARPIARPAVAAYDAIVIAVGHQRVSRLGRSRHSRVRQAKRRDLRRQVRVARRCGGRASVSNR